MSTGRMIGVDVGGTFTDIFYLDERNSTLSVGKVPTTQPDQSEGFLQGIESKSSNLAELSAVVHGTTAGTNALLERKGAKLGIITTKGFKDVLEMRRRDRRQTWGLRGDFDPVVPRDRRLEVEERVLAAGQILTPVNLSAVRDAAIELMEMGCTAVALVFINSYANPKNEQEALKTVKEVWPNEHISASSDILPEIREFERTSTTTLNAYLQPEVSGYLNRLERNLRTNGFAGKFMVVQSNGGVMDVETACEHPIRTALSGPAAGVIAASYIATSAGFPNVITGDMGGTSFDVSLIIDGNTTLSAQTSLDFGMVVRTPMIEMTTIGAGGGSIAWVDNGGLLNIGPESAGSTPGPVAYGRGNDRPTVTDANIVLGRIDPNNPIGDGLGKLDLEAAAKAIDIHIGAALDLSTTAAAEAILSVANSRMAGAIRLMSVERGHDPKNFVFMPFGGGGALHACSILSSIGLAGAIIPPYPGVTSAIGCVIADMRQDFVQTINALLSELDINSLVERMQSHANEGKKLLSKSNIAFTKQDFFFELDMAYVGQTHTISVPVPVELIDGKVLVPTLKELQDAFDGAYKKQYGRLLPDSEKRILNLRSAAIGRRPKFDLTSFAPKKTATVEGAHKGSRQVFIGNGWHDTAIYRRLELPTGARIEGPAILEQPDTTILIEPQFYGEVDQFGNIILKHVNDRGQANG